MRGSTMDDLDAPVSGGGEYDGVRAEQSHRRRLDFGEEEDNDNVNGPPALSRDIGDDEERAVHADTAVESRPLHEGGNGVEDPGANANADDGHDAPDADGSTCRHGPSRSMSSPAMVEGGGRVGTLNNATTPDRLTTTVATQHSISPASAVTFGSDSIVTFDSGSRGGGGGNDGPDVDAVGAGDGGPESEVPMPMPMNRRYEGGGGYRTPAFSREGEDDSDDEYDHDEENKDDTSSARERRRRASVVPPLPNPPPQMSRRYYHPGPGGGMTPPSQRKTPSISNTTASRTISIANNNPGHRHYRTASAPMSFSSSLSSSSPAVDEFNNNGTASDGVEVAIGNGRFARRSSPGPIRIKRYDSDRTIALPPSIAAEAVAAAATGDAADGPSSPMGVGGGTKDGGGKGKDGAASSASNKRESNASSMNDRRDDGGVLSCLSLCCGGARNHLSATRISSFLVRRAPCFWCSPRLDVSATDRAILFRLNVLCAFMALGQIATGLFCAITVTWVDYDERAEDAQDEALERNTYLSPNYWNPIGSIFLLCLVGFVLFVTALITLRVISQVNLLGALRYYWVLMWIIPIEIFLSLSLFDYHRVTDVWVKHWWRTPALAWFRHKFCQPFGTSETKCKAPENPCVNYVSSGEHYSVDDWCRDEFGSLDCHGIKEAAQASMKTVSYVFFTVCAVWGLLLVVLLFLTVHALEGIVSTPIIQSSKERNIPAWLILPIVGCTWAGATLLFAPSSVIIEFGSNVFWIGVTYVVSAGMFFFSAMLGLYISFTSVLSRRDKKRKQFAVHLFIIIMILTIFSVAAIFASSLIYSVSLVDLEVDDYRRGDIACNVDSAESCDVLRCMDEDFVSGSGASCSNNTATIPGCSLYYTRPRCPAWCTDDVLTVLRTQLKQSATLAAIFLLYAFSALRFGFVLKKHVMMYQIDYV